MKNEKIIQFGEGNFLRGFIDYFIDELNRKNLFDGKIVVVQPRKGGRVYLLNEQNGKYNLYMRGVQGGEVISEHRLIDSVSRGIDPYVDFNGYLNLADNEDFRFIISNTTEAGIAYDKSCDFSDKPCASFPGKLTQLLFRRYEKGLNGFIILPCELIDKNGDELKKCVLQYAEQWQLGEAFVQWINESNTFTNTLVDRIVTGYPSQDDSAFNLNDKLVDTCEIFHLWVIENNYETELPLQKAGLNVIWTNDVSPYKKRKVRILNGAHTSMVAGALLAGVETVGECMNDETVFAYLNKCISDEILPAIGDTEDNRRFASDVYDRFRNPYIKHQLRAIALNSVSKFSVRVLPSLLDYKEKFGSYPKCLVMSLAFLIEFYKKDEPQDSPEIINLVKNSSLKEILSDSSLWNTDLSDLQSEVQADIDIIDKIGAKEAMKWIVSQ